MPTMNSNDVGKGLNMSDHMMMVHPRKLRPLMPRSSAATTKTPTSSSTMSSAPHHHYCIPNTSICAWNYHLPASSVHQQSCKRSEFISAEPLVSPRWNPTAEQIEALEDMYKRGLRTPTAEQIQQIAAKLRQFGKIEGKNVFYWFQNHKARERQKWRRQLGFIPQKKKPSRDDETIQNKEPEISKKDIEEDQQDKNWESLSICSRILPQDSAISKHRAVMAESRISKRKRVKKATLQADLSSHHQPHKNYLFNTLSSTKYTNNDDVDDDDMKMENENRENHQILQLFPPGSNKEKENEVFTTNINTTSFAPIQFFEFLPLKI